MADLISSGTHITIGGVECWDEGCDEAFTRTNNYATRTLVCRWSDRRALMNAIRGDDSITVGPISVFPSTPYLDVPNLYPDTFDIKGEGALTQTVAGDPAYKYARVKVKYTSLDPGTLQIELASQVLTLPRTGPILKFAGSGKDVPFQDTPGKPMVVFTLTKGIPRISSIPLAKLRTAAEKPLNSNEFLGFAPRTVMFDGGRAVRYLYASAAGGTLYDLELRFLARPALEWDKLAEKQGDGSYVFDQALFKDTGDPYIDNSDLNALFDNT